MLSARVVVRVLSKYVQTIRLNVASQEVHVAVKVAAVLQETCAGSIFTEKLCVVLKGIVVPVLL